MYGHHWLFCKHHFSVSIHMLCPDLFSTHDSFCTLYVIAGGGWLELI